MKKLDYLIDYLLKENKEIKTIKLSENIEEKKTLFRGLCNIREPKEISEEFLKIQDEYLQEELSFKNIIDVKKLKTIEEEFETSIVKNKDKICIWQGDITTLKIDAIVNAGNSALLGCFIPCHRCIDNAIHSASGIQLRLKCNEIMTKQKYEEIVGNAKITPAYNLLCEYVIHTVGPITNGNPNKKQLEELELCYKSCLNLAVKNNIKSIAFCCISTGEFKFPKNIASNIAIRTIDDFIKNNRNKIERVVLNVFSKEDYNIYLKNIKEKS